MLIKKKKLFLNVRKTRYCWVKVYDSAENMREAAKKSTSQNVNDAVGLHEAYRRFHKGKFVPETGIIYLNTKWMGAGVVDHEIMHAIFWAWKNNKDKKQYPIVINNMKQEENILQNLTFAIRQYWLWYFKFEKLFA